MKRMTRDKTVMKFGFEGLFEGRKYTQGDKLHSISHTEK